MGRNDAGLSCATPPPPPVPLPRGGAPQPLRPVPACATAHLCPRDPFCISQHPGCARTNRSRAARPRCGSTQWSRAASHHTSRGRPANTAMNAFSAPVQAACTCSQSTRRVMIVLCLAPSLSILRPWRIFYHRIATLSTSCTPADKMVCGLGEAKRLSATADECQATTRRRPSSGYWDTPSPSFGSEGMARRPKESLLQSGRPLSTSCSFRSLSEQAPPTGPNPRCTRRRTHTREGEARWKSIW